VDDLHAVPLVRDATFVHEVELVNRGLVAVSDRPTVKAVLMPSGHLHHLLDHVGDPVLLFRSARAVDVQWSPSALDPSEHHEVRKVTHVVHVQVREEDVIDRIERNAERVVVAQ
jgi:hypothetical protein